MDTCAAIAVVIQVFGFGLVWAFVAGAAAAGRMGHSRRERQPAAQAAVLFVLSGVLTVHTQVTQQTFNKD